MTSTELKNKLMSARSVRDFYDAYKEYPEHGAVISSAIIETIKEMTQGRGRLSRSDGNSLIELHRQIGIDRSSKKVEEKPFLPHKTQRAYTNLRQFLKHKGDFVPLIEIRKQPFFQDPQIKAWLLEEFPKGLAYEDAGNFLLYATEWSNPYKVMHGEYGESIQTLPSVTKFPRKTYILTVYDLLEEIGKEDDPAYQTFVNELLIKGVHEESVGIPGKNFGWIIYREIDENTLFIEQIQTDLYRIFHRIQKGIEHMGQGDSLFRHIVMMLGGEEKVEEIEQTLSKYVENYFEILLSAFMEDNIGKDLYLSTPEIIKETVPDDPPAHIYKKTPEKYKFQLLPGDKAPFDTGGLPIYFRHNAMRKVKKYSYFSQKA